MTQSNSTTVSSTLRSMVRTRVVVFAPIMIATLSLSSLARAQEPATPEAAASATAPSGTTAPPAGAIAVAPSAPAAPSTPAALTTTTITTTTTTTGAPAFAEPVGTPAATRTRVHEGFYLRLTSRPS